MANNKKYRTGKSKIQGKGVFAKQNLKPGDYIGKVHTIKQLYTDYDFTDLGRNHNHSDNPNVQNVLVGNERHLVAIKPIKKGQELTSNYRLQPDLEQPEDFQDGGKIKPLKAQDGDEIPGWLYGARYPGRIKDDVRRDLAIKNFLFAVADDFSGDVDSAEEVLYNVNQGYGSDRLENRVLQDYYGFDYADLVPEKIAKYKEEYRKAFPGEPKMLDDSGEQEFKNGGWLDEYNDGGAVESRQGGYTDIPFRHNGAWGGQFQNGGEMQIGANPEDADIKEIYDWEKRYTNSPRFTELSQKQGDSPKMTQRRINAINEFDINKDIIRIPEGSSYVQNGKFYLSPSMGDWPSYSEINAHEFGHLPYATGNLKFPKNTYKEIQSRNKEFIKSRASKKIDEDIKHDISPYETRADKNELLYQLQKMGIYDATKDGDIKQEHLDEFKKSDQWNRLLRLYDDKDILWLINNVAMSSKPGLNDMAKNGIDYQLGGNVYPVNYVPQAAMGGSTGGTFPGSTGFMYARTQGAAPSEGPYAKKTMPSAEDGMSFYQHGLDWKPRNISRDGNLVKYDPGGTVNPCPEGYKPDGKGGCIPDFSYVPRPKNVPMSTAVNQRVLFTPGQVASAPTKKQYDQAEINRKAFENQPQLKQSRQLTPQEKEAERKRTYELNKQHALKTGKKFNYNTGEIAARDAKTYGDGWGYVNTPALTQSAAMLTPGGNNYDAGEVGAESFVNMNPLITGQIMSASRLSGLGKSLVTGDAQANPYFGSDRGFVDNAFGALNLAGDLGMMRVGTRGSLGNRNPVINHPSMPSISDRLGLRSPVATARTIGEYGRVPIATAENFTYEGDPRFRVISTEGLRGKKISFIDPADLEKFNTSTGYPEIFDISLPGTGSKQIATSSLPLMEGSGRAITQGDPLFYMTYRNNPTSPQALEYMRRAALKQMNEGVPVKRGELLGAPNYEAPTGRTSSLQLPRIPLKVQPNKYGGITKAQDGFVKLPASPAPNIYKTAPYNLEYFNKYIPMYRNTYGVPRISDGDNYDAFYRNLQKIGVPRQEAANITAFMNSYYTTDGKLKNVSVLDSYVPPPPKGFVSMDDPAEEKKRIERDKKKQGVMGVDYYKKGGIIKDDRGQSAHPGEITEISSPNITMQGVPYPVLGIGRDGQQIMMQPGQDYTFNEGPVTEIPMAQDGENLPAASSLDDVKSWLKKWYTGRQNLPQFKDIAQKRLDVLDKVGMKYKKNLGPSAAARYPLEGYDVEFLDPKYIDPTTAHGRDYIPTAPLIGHEVTHVLTQHAPQEFPKDFFNPTTTFEQFNRFKPKNAESWAGDQMWGWLGDQPQKYIDERGRKKIRLVPGLEDQAVLTQLSIMENLNPEEVFTKERFTPIVGKYKKMREDYEQKLQEWRNMPKKERGKMPQNPMSHDEQIVEWFLNKYGYDPEKIAQMRNEVVRTDRTDIPIAQDGNDIPRSDSVILRNNALAKINFYKNNPKYEKSTQLSTSPKLFSPKALTRLAKDSVKLSKSKNSINSLNWAYATQEERPFDEKQTRNRLGKVKGASTLYKSPDFEYDFVAKVSSPDAAQIDTYYNPDSPTIYFSDRIVPQGVDLYKSGYYGDISITPYYDPLAVSPWDMLTPKEQKLRLKKYGPSGTPYANPKPKEEPKLKRVPYNPETIKPTRSETSPIQIRPIPGIPQVQIEIPELPYMVEYQDPETGDRVYKHFPSDKEGKAFMDWMNKETMENRGNYYGIGGVSGAYESSDERARRLRNEKKYPKKKTGGWLDEL